MNNKKDFIGGFKELFTSMNNLKLILAMVLVVFIIAFIAFGGCAQGISLCGGSGDAAEPAAEASGMSNCGGSGSQGGKPSAIKVFEGATVTSGSYIDDYRGMAITFSYPQDGFTFSTAEEDLLTTSLDMGKSILKGADFAIQTQFVYVSDMDNPATGEDA